MRNIVWEKKKRVGIGWFGELGEGETREEESEGGERKKQIITVLVRERGEEPDVLGIIPSSILVLVDVGNDGNGGEATRKIGDKPKAGDSQLRLSTIELGDDIGSPNGLSNDDHWTVVARLRLTVQGLLDTSVAH